MAAILLASDLLFIWLIPIVDTTPELRLAVPLLPLVAPIIAGFFGGITVKTLGAALKSSLMAAIIDGLATHFLLRLALFGSAGNLIWQAPKYIILLFVLLFVGAMVGLAFLELSSPARIDNESNQLT
jgi:uncharacterized membrane protein